MKLINKNDIIVIAVILAVCGAMLFLPDIFNKNQNVAEVIINGKTEYSIKLDDVAEPYVIETPTSPKTEISVEKGSICFSDSDCTEKYCVNSGKLTSGGQTSACLPARVVIVIKGGKSDNDMLTY